MATVLKICLNGNSVDISSTTEEKVQIKKGVIQLEEQKEYQILFPIDENPPDARLYMTSLDLPIQREREKYPAPPDHRGWSKDGKDGYRKPKESAFWLVRNNDDYDALRVGIHDIWIEHAGQTFLAQIEVIPNQSLMPNQWAAMCDEVEQDYAGLARDIVRQSLGFKVTDTDRLSTEKLYRFQVFHSYNLKMLSALMGIQKAPKNKIVTQYQELPAGRSCRMDPTSIQMTAINGKRKNCVYTPKKQISYDIPENRLLKKIISIYDRELSDFLTLIDEELKKASAKFTHKQTKTASDYSLIKFKDSAESLCKISYIIKNQPWYQEIKSATTETFPHSFAMDPCYGTLYKMYQELQKDTIEGFHNEQNWFSWKTSRDLYELWCFITLCRAFMEDDAWELVGSSLTYENGSVFPTLKPGTKLVFIQNENKNNSEKCAYNLRIDFIYNGEVGVRQAKNENDPFYFISGNHKLPDIRIDLYTYLPDTDQEITELLERPNQYWGTLIFECKYRTLKGIWDSKYHNREQIQDYYRAARTDWNCHIVENAHKYFQPVCRRIANPTSVKQVIVLTPDTSCLEKTLENPVPEYVDFLPLKPSESSRSRCKDILKEVVKDFIDKQLESGYHYTRPKTKTEETVSAQG